MALYEQSTLGTATNQVIFNDTVQAPYMRVQSRMPQNRQLRDLDIPIPFESGIMDFETLVGKTAYIIQGTMYPGSEYEHDQGLQALRKVANLEIAQADPLSDGGYVPYTWREYGRDKTLFLKVLYVSIKEVASQGMVKQFTFVCKIKDPTIYGYDTKIATTAPIDPNGTRSGSAVYPIVYPINFGETTYMSSQVAENIGDLPTYPISIIVRGQCTDPKIANTNINQFIQFTGLTMANSTDILRLVYDKDTLQMEMNGINVLDKVSSDSTFFKIHPGDNRITLISTNTADTGAYVEVTYRDAWPLS